MSTASLFRAKVAFMKEWQPQNPPSVSNEVVDVWNTRSVDQTIDRFKNKMNSSLLIITWIVFILYVHNNNNYCYYMTTNKIYQHH